VNGKVRTQMPEGEQKMAQDMEMMMEFDGSVDQGEPMGISGKTDIRWRMLGNVIYLFYNVESLESTNKEAQEGITQVMPYIKQFGNVWYKIDYEELQKLAKAQGEELPLMPQSYMGKDMERMTELLKNKEVFSLVKVLPEEKGQYMYEVKVNPEYMAEIEKIFMETMQGTEEQKAQVAAIMGIYKDMIGKEVITLAIDKKTKEYREMRMQGTIMVKDIVKAIAKEEAMNTEGMPDIQLPYTLTMLMDAKKEMTVTGKMEFKMMVEGAGEMTMGTVEGTMSYNQKTKSGEGEITMKSPQLFFSMGLKGKVGFVEEKVVIEEPKESRDLVKMIQGLETALKDKGGEAEEVERKAKEEQLKEEARAKAEAGVGREEVEVAPVE
jgi:hypothetical protein